MRENEFEKLVQQKIGDFNLNPSAEVWTEVERRIRKEKRRRFIVWWPLFFLLAGGGIAAGILLTNKKKKEEIIAANKEIKKSSESSLNEKNVTEPVNNSQSIDRTDTTSNTNTSTIVKYKRDEIKITSDNTATNFKPARQIKEKKTTAIVLEKKSNKKNRNADGNKDIVTKDKLNNNQETNLPVTSIVTSKPTTPSKEADKTNDIAIVTKKEVLEDKTQQEQVMRPADSVSKTETTKPADKKMSKWDWGIHFSAGQSSIGQGLSFSGQRLNFDALASQVSSPPGLFSNSSSPVRSSFSWATGVFFKKAISKKLDFNVGISYSYLSTKINTGSRVDSTRLINNYYSQGLTVNNFYRSGSNSSHTNAFHFVNLSADLSWRIIGGRKVNIYWENGLSYNRMFASSMLHFDRNLQGYYKDNSLLAKNQLDFSIGLSIPVSKRLQVNPFVSYHLTPVLKNSDTLHFTNYGIRIRFLMNKK